MASETFLKFGVHFPLHQFFRDILLFYRLTVFQVTPNGWAHMIGLFILFVERKMDPPTFKEFSWFYTLKTNKGDLRIFYFAKKAAKGVQAVTKIKESLGNWKDAFSLLLRSVFEATSTLQVSFSSSIFLKYHNV